MVADPEVTTAVLNRPQLFEKRIVSYKMVTKVGDDSVDMFTFWVAPFANPDANLLVFAFQALSRHNLVNLITSETDALWRSINRSIGPSFTWDNLYKMFPTVRQVWTEVRDSAASNCGSAYLDIDRLMTEANFETILRLGFRYTMDTICTDGGPLTEGHKFLDAMAEAFKVAFVMLNKQKAESRSLFRRRKPTEGDEEHETFIELWKLSEALVKHSRSIGLSPNDPEIGGRLLHSIDPSTGKPLSDEKLAAEITILLIAGHETSSHTTSMALGLLAMNPETLRKVEAELDSLGLLATPTNPRPRVPTFEDLDKLKYTWQAAKEASRLFPALFFLPRQAMKDTVVCGMPVAKGTLFVCCVGALQRSGKFEITLQVIDFSF
jgi:cytochrome P450